MTSDLLYHVSVKNGVVSDETGHFYKAAPFSVLVDAGQFDVVFEMGDSHRVVYKVSRNGATAMELEHPDYATSQDAADLAPELAALFGALVHVQIVKNKDYSDFYADSANGVSFEINQAHLDI